jgi:hypothetical protein
MSDQLKCRFPPIIPATLQAPKAIIPVEIKTDSAVSMIFPLLSAAERAVNVFDKPRLPDVLGKTLLKDAAGNWFRDIVRDRAHATDS